MSSAKQRLCCLGPNVLSWQPHLTEANDLKFHQFLQGISKIPIAYEIQEWVDGGVDIGQPVRGFI